MNCSIEGRTRTSVFESAHADGSSFKQAKNVEKADAVLCLAAFCYVFALRVPALSLFRTSVFLLHARRADL
ncbi:unnamed protein product [Ectocarpus sp. 12 AP-2014]